MTTLTGWIDYDRPQLPLLNPMEQVDYFEKRVRQSVVNPLYRILDTEIHPTPDSSALLIFGVSICCAIEALGKFLNGGRGKSSERFFAFLYKYMNANYQSQRLGTNTFGEILWKYFRNGLAHGFTICHGGFEGPKGTPYFIVKGNTLMICPAELYSDFVNGFEQYLSDLRTTKGSGSLFMDFDVVFKEVFVLGN